MRILCLEARWSDGDTVTEQLRADGHDVVRCHDEAAGPSAPCVGLDRPGSCPLDIDGGVDVAVAVRPDGEPHPTPREAGVTCALRQGIPLVVTGGADPGPFARWGVTVPAGGDVTAACHEAQRRTLDELGRTIAIATCQAVGGPYRAGADIRADVARRGQELVVTVYRPVGARALDGAIATHAHRAARDGQVPARSISVTCVDG
jgi:hypothetical protein